MDKHPIDRLFKNKLDSHEWAFSDSAWDDALSLLRSQKRKRRRLIALWWTLGVISLLSISVLAWTFLRETSQVQLATDLVAKLALSSEEESADGAFTDLSITDEIVPESSNGNHRIDNIENLKKPAKSQLEENHVFLHNPKADDNVNRTSRSQKMETGTIGNLMPDHGRDNFISSTSSLKKPLLSLSALTSFVKPVIWDKDLVPSVESMIPVFNDKLFPIHRSAGGLVSGLAVTFFTDVNPGLFSNDQTFQDHSLRVGFQQALSPFFAAEIRGGSRFFSGELPVHAQTAQVSYSIGSETTTYQLKAEQLIMAGLGLALHAGIKKHRFSAALDVDRLIAAHGIMREQLFVQERRLQDRNAKPVTVSEQRTWIDTEGITPWNYSTELSYRYAISPKFELGVAWVHRFQEFVINDQYSSDRLSFTVKKIF